MFQKAVIDRFIPFVFKGRLCSKFETVMDPKQIMRDNEKIYQGFIATINYYKENPLTSIKYEMPREVYFSKDRISRYGKSFNIIAKYVAAYCEDQKSFNTMILELYKCYTDYESLLGGEQEEGQKKIKAKTGKTKSLF